MRDSGSVVAELRARLGALSPQATLERGYSIAQLPSGAVLRDPADAPDGPELPLAVAGGRLGATSAGAIDHAVGTDG